MPCNSFLDVLNVDRTVHEVKQYTVVVESEGAVQQRPQRVDRTVLQEQ